MRAGTDDCFALAGVAGWDYVNDIVTVQPRPKVAKDLGGKVRCRAFWGRLEFVDGKGLVVAHGEYIRRREESSVAD